MHYFIPNFFWTIYGKKIIKIHVLQIEKKFDHLFVIVADNYYEIIISWKITRECLFQ